MCTKTHAIAFVGPDTRTTQVNISLVDLSRLDAGGFAPFGEVTDGMVVVNNRRGYSSGLVDSVTVPLSFPSCADVVFQLAACRSRSHVDPQLPSRPRPRPW